MKYGVGILFFISSVLFSDSYKLTHPLYNPGFFSVFNTVLGALDIYEKSPECDGLVVDFEDKGLYYDEKVGSNWWEYYFEPIELGSLAQEKRFPTYKKITFSMTVQFEIGEIRAHELIERYIHLRPHIQEKLDLFVRNHFEGRKVIGIHYRGTDKKIEAPEVPYERMKDYVAKELETEENLKVFVATDEEQFLMYMCENFPGKVVAIDAIRSQNGEPVHLSSFQDKDIYQTGEDAVLDCILLSKCSKVYKMASNLSDTSSKFNPDLQVIHLNKSYSDDGSPKKQNLVKAINTVLFLLDQHEKNEQKGFSVHFPVKEEKYSDKEGSNWWNYHFLPLSVGVGPSPIALKNYSLTILGLDNLLSMSRERASYLIEKYIQLQPQISEKIERFVKSFDGDYIVGVSYNPSPIERLQATVSYEEVFEKIERHVQENKLGSYKIFLVTQDLGFAEKMKERYGAVLQVCNLQDEKDLTSAEQEERSLVNAFLLAESSVVIGPSTEFLKFVGQINPYLPIEECDTLWFERR